MSTRMVILGLLRDRQLYGYEIKHIIEDHMGDWTSIAFGSIYFALSKLEEEGKVEKVAVEKDGERPSRHIYQLTASGEAEFNRLLRENWSTLQRTYFDLDIGLFFMDALPKDEVIGYITKRVKHLEGVMQHLEMHKAEQLADPEVPRRAAVIFDHSYQHFKAELAWTCELLEKAVAGEL